MVENNNSGALLKSIRQEKGLSVEAVHEVTKIPMDVIRAIEEGYTVRTLSPFYYRGFLKIYARYLEIDTSRIIDDYKQEHSSVIKSSKMNVDDNLFLDYTSQVAKKINPKYILIALGVLIVFFLVNKIIAQIAKNPTQPKKVSVSKDESGKRASWFAFNANNTKKNTPEPKKTEVKKTEKIEKKEEPKTQAPAAVAPTSEVTPVEAESAGQTVSKNVTLAVRAKKSSWLRVKVDGAVVFQSTLNAGSVETWNADNKIEISGKNISQLEFELNGKMIGALGREERSAKTVVVTKDGLSVTK